MKALQKLLLMALVAAMMPMQSFAQNPFGLSIEDSLITRDIYGYDSRREAKTYDYKGYTQSVLTKMPKAEFDGDKVYGLTLEGYLKLAYKADKVDPSVKFLNQPAIGGCTGFLIAPDIMVTAGHCISGDPHSITDGQIDWHVAYNNKQNDIKVDDSYWVFGYTNDINMTSYNHPTYGKVYGATIPQSYQYAVKIILKSVLSSKQNLDYAIVQFERPTDVEPFRFRTGEKIQKGAGLAMIGSPAGLPLKLADGAEVTINGADTWFGTNLDAFGGNSGGPVYATGGLSLIEGILVRGRIDKGIKGYYLDSTCTCVKEVKYDNDASKSILDDILNIPEEDISTEVQRITSIPWNIRVLAVYNNVEYSIKNNNQDRFDKWMAYSWVYREDTFSYIKNVIQNRDPLAVQAIKQNRISMFEAMVDAGYSVTMPYAYGRSVLYTAITYGRTDAVRYILQKGYNLEQEDNMCDTPLFWAIQTGELQMVEILVENGASLTHANSSGESPAKYAAKSKQKVIKKYLKKAAKRR